MSANGAVRSGPHSALRQVDLRRPAATPSPSAPRAAAQALEELTLLLASTGELTAAGLRRLPAKRPPGLTAAAAAHPAWPTSPACAALPHTSITPAAPSRSPARGTPRSGQHTP